MVALKLYVEGGGVTRDDQRSLKEGFAKLLAKVIGGRAKPRIIACGGRGNAFHEFEIAIRAAAADELCVLLVDSEGPIAAGPSPWQHVATRKGDGWVRPEGSTDDQLHFMVEAMEAWLLADREALAAYYGQGFKAGALPGRNNVEEIPKADLMKALESATRGVKTKGKSEYRKSHGFELIALVDPGKVEKRAPRAAALFEYLRSNLPPR